LFIADGSTADHRDVTDAGMRETLAERVVFDQKAKSLQ
jgi:hypothetical protein